MANRLSWGQVPDHVRAAVEASLGSDVIEANTQPGGFSPGAAVRLRLANGRRTFVKALSNDIHAPSAGMYRTEARVMPRLPADLPVPRLFDVYDDCNWVALIFEDVEGRHPGTPWTAGDLDRVGAAINDLAIALNPSPWPDAPTFTEANAGVKRAWEALTDSRSPELDPAVARLLDRVERDRIDWDHVFAGEALLHNDMRSDNMLLTSDDRVVFLDWGMACKGPAWLDLVLFAFTIGFDGVADADVLVRRHPLTRDLPPSGIDLIVGAGYAAMRWLAGQPKDPEMVDTDAYHRESATTALRWVQRRVAPKP